MAKLVAFVLMVGLAVYGSFLIANEAASFDRATWNTLNVELSNAFNGRN